MTTRIIVLCVAILFAPTTAIAIDRDMLTLNLGAVLAAEKFCGFQYDQTAIQDFIDKNVDADNLGFPSELSAMTSGSKYNQESMSESEKTAHCHQISRIAKSYRFISN